MNITQNTILITGGTSGIGFELAKRFLDLGNTVIVTGRDLGRLNDTKAKLPKVHTVQSDVSDIASIEALHQKLLAEFPHLNVLINNAGIMRKINLNDPSGDLADVTREIEINLSGPIRMIKQFLPHLKSKKNAVIINVSSGLAFVPFPISPVYSATKAGLHAYTECLRIQMKNSSVEIIELAPPGTETPLFRDGFTQQDLEGAKAMSVEDLGQHCIEGLQKGRLEIRPGLSNVLKIMSRVAPQFILKQLGKPVEHMKSH